MRTIVKNLKKYKWIYSNKRITVSNKITNFQVELDKIGFLSLSRFILRCLDTMRIEDIKKLRLDMIKQKEKNRESLKQIKERFNKKSSKKIIDIS